MDHNESDRDREDLMSDSTATLFHEDICAKLHPSNLTASFKVMGEASLSVYQHSFSDKPVLWHQRREAEIRHGSLSGECWFFSIGETSAGYWLSYSSGASTGRAYMLCDGQETFDQWPYSLLTFFYLIIIRCTAIQSFLQEYRFREMFHVYWCWVPE